MTAKLQFGNEEHIKLVQLAKKLDECVVIEISKHDCDCEYCEYETEHCISCGATEKDLFEYVDCRDDILECKKCDQRGVYKKTIYSLKNKLKELQSDAK